MGLMPRFLDLHRHSPSSTYCPPIGLHRHSASPTNCPIGLQRQSPCSSNCSIRLGRQSAGSNYCCIGLQRYSATARKMHGSAEAVLNLGAVWRVGGLGHPRQRVPPGGLAAGLVAGAPRQRVAVPCRI